MGSTPEMKLSYYNHLDRLWSVTKTRQDNDVINHIGLVYIKNDNELSGPIGPSAVNDETRHDNDVTNLLRAVYTGNETELS